MADNTDANLGEGPGGTFSNRLSHAYVRDAAIDPLPPPANTVGLVGWLRSNLFSSPLNIALTLFGILLAVWIIPPIVKFLITDAVWNGTNREACINKEGQAPVGACWAFVRDRFAYTIYGSYPVDGRWRANIFFLLGAIAVLWVLHPRAPQKGWAMLFAFVITPLVSYGLLSGNNPLGFLTGPIGMFTGESSVLGSIFWAIILLLAGYFVASQMGLDSAKAAAAAVGTLVGGVVIGLIFAKIWGAFGLENVPTNRWGGLMVTLVVAAVGIVVSLPIGILLALGRRSKMPIVKFFSVTFIEFVRGVPLITVLFMANTMLPLFLPEAWSPDKLLRALVGIAMFASAYMAEVVRSGLQALPKGQYEGAMAMGLNYSQMMRLIILPQALKVAIPNIVNTYIGLLKDTSLLLIVGIFDFLKAIETARIDPIWAAPTTSATGYAYAAIVYFLMCYGMARYARNMERRLAVADKR
jgi:general L-amino acid transport system permease protein